MMEVVKVKSNTISEASRNEGNRFYVQKKFFDAVLKYNESLCYAENGSQNIGLAYANRSAVFFEMKLYENCLLNIAMARKHNYPKKNFEILSKRESKCIELMKNIKSPEEDSTNFFRLTHKSHKHIPAVANCLELKFDKKYGRHIVTNRDLEVGDIVAIEAPIFHVIKADSRYSTCYDSNIYQRCANCLDENFLDLVPCEFCNKTMFCSERCKIYAQTHHHRYECSIIEFLLKSGIKHVILRMLFEAISLFDHSIEKLQMFIDRHREMVMDMTIFQSKNDTKRREDSFLLAMSLSSVAQSKENSLDEFVEIFKKSTALEAIWGENKIFISSLLQKLIVVGNRDIHGIGSWSLKRNGMEEYEEPKFSSQYQQLVGNACFAFSSLLNHSCAPNIRRLNYQNKNVIIVARPIKAGQQLFDSYRQNFNLQPKAERMEGLMKDYGFQCDCEACSEDWPVNRDLKVIDESLLEHICELYDELPFVPDKTVAENRFREFCSIFSSYHKEFPSAELIILQECISNCLLTLTKPSLQFP